MSEVSCKHDRRRHPIVLLFNDGVLISEITKEGKVIQNVALLAISKKMVVICFYCPNIHLKGLGVPRKSSVRLLNNDQWRTEGGVWGVQPTPPPSSKFRSFDEAEPNSQFRRKYIRNNLTRIRLSLIF